MLATIFSTTDPAGGFVGDAFIDQAVLAEHVAVVSHVDDQCLVVNPHLLQLLRDRANAVIDGTQCLAVALVEGLGGGTAVQRKIHAVPAVALVEQPTRPVGVIVRLQGAGIRQ